MPIFNAVRHIINGSVQRVCVVRSITSLDCTLLGVIQRIKSIDCDRLAKDRSGRLVGRACGCCYLTASALGKGMIDKIYCHYSTPESA